MPPKCPYCNETLNYDEQIEHWEDYGTCGATYSGWCTKCKREYKWDELFTFSHCENVKEVKEEE